MANPSRDIKYVLYLYVNNDFPELVDKYRQSVDSHNMMVSCNNFPDSGFDLYIPDDISTNLDGPLKVSMQVKTSMYKFGNTNEPTPCGYYMYPRSSIYKSPFRLANNVGIIDSGYRGYLGGVFDIVRKDNNSVYSKHSRLLQICSPTLEPFKVCMVFDEIHLGETERGTGGFGSTGV